MAAFSKGYRSKWYRPASRSWSHAEGYAMKEGAKDQGNYAIDLVAAWWRDHPEASNAAPAKRRKGRAASVTYRAPEPDNRPTRQALVSALADLIRVTEKQHGTQYAAVVQARYLLTLETAA